MILEYNGTQVSFKKIQAEVRVKDERGGGSYMEYAASFLASVCSNPILFEFNSEIQPSWHITAETHEIAESLRQLVKGDGKKKYCLKKLLLFLEQGGVYRPQPLPLAGLQALVRDRRPVIVTLEPNHIQTEKGRSIEAMSHAVVVVGYTKNEILFLDPAESATPVKMDKNIFLWAWYYDGGSALFL
jgi:hypothetical protein